MTDKNRKSKQFLTNWPSSHAPKYTSAESTKTASIHEETLDHVSTNELQQGELYILKIKLIAIALFQGWDDDMCCFSVLRTDLLEDLRWSEARYLPENFDAYLAFDYAGNPPIHLWTKQLRAVIPINWFNIFEEARHMQRQWNVSYWDPNATTAVVEQPHYYTLTDNNPTIEEITDDDQDTEEKTTTEDEYKSDTTEEKQAVEPNTVPDPSPPISSLAANNSLLLTESPITHYAPSPVMPTPAMRLQKQYKLEVTQQEQQQQQQQKQPKSVPVQTEPTKQKNDQQQQQQQQEKKPEMKQRRSFSSFFLKKKKSKKSLRDEDHKRSSAPPTPLLDTTAYQLKPADKQQSVTSESNEETSSTSSPVLKTPKNDVDHSTKKVELLDIDSYFDMQATFAFLNNSNTDNFSLLDNASSINNTKAVTTL